MPILLYKVKVSLLMIDLVVAFVVSFCLYLCLYIAVFLCCCRFSLNKDLYTKGQTSATVMPTAAALGGGQMPVQGESTALEGAARRRTDEAVLTVGSVVVVLVESRPLTDGRS